VGKKKKINSKATLQGGGGKKENGETHSVKLLHPGGGGREKGGKAWVHPTPRKKKEKTYGTCGYIPPLLVGERVGKCPACFEPTRKETRKEVDTGGPPHPI